MTDRSGGEIASIRGPWAWKPQDYEDPSSFRHLLTPRQVEELNAVGRDLKERDFSEIAVDEMQDRLASLNPLVNRIRADLVGRGFSVVRGVPVEQLGLENSGIAFWAVGSLIGTGLTQNASGELLCPITDVGTSYKTFDEYTTARGYQTNAGSGFHTDPTDVVGLLCVRKSKSGGISEIVSSATIYNELLRRHPAQLSVLERGFFYGRKLEQGLGESPLTARIPVFERHGDRVSCRFIKSFIQAATRHGVELSAEEQAAIECFDTLSASPGLALQMTFEPGDIQFLNNHTVLHSRTAFEDYPEAERKRFLYRLWLQMEDQSPWGEVSDAMRWGCVRYGNLGLTPPEATALRRREAEQIGVAP